jgi:branched-chain amino acid transport system permease protein
VGASAVPSRRWAHDLTRTGPTRWLVLLVVYLAASLLAAHGSLYIQGLIEVGAIFAVAALSLDLVLGTTGMFSLGHAGLLGVGAYLTTILWTNMGWNIFLVLPMSVLGSALCGLVIGTASRRVGGLQFAIITFIFTLILTTLETNLQITGGADGLLGPSSPTLPSWLGSSTLWLAMLVLLVGVVVTWSVRRSPLYPVLSAVRDAERFAESAGARVAALRIGMFALSGALVGLAGWAFSLFGAVGPDQFTWTQSANILIMVLLGGMNTALGPILGAAIVSVIPTAIGLQSYVDNVIFGVVMVVVVVLFRKGVIGTLQQILSRRIAAFGGGRRVTRTTDVPTQTQAPALDALYADVGRTPATGVQRNGWAVECNEVSFRYPGSAVHAVDGVDIHVAAGTIHGLIGPNGSGKSTVIDIISGRQRPESGTVVVNDQVVDGRASGRAGLGFMRTFQAASLVSELSGLENTVVGAYSRLRHIALRAPLWGVLPGTRRDYQRLQGEAATALRAVGVAESDARRLVADVPQAVRQLVQLSAACVARPSTLVLDEPLAGLSVGEVEHVKALLRELKALGVTIIIVEHQTQFVFEICDHVTVLNSGSLVVSGDAATVRQDDRVREVYLGLPAVLHQAKG